MCSWPAVRAFVAVVNDGRAVNDGCSETALDALTRAALRELPDLGAQLFAAPPNTTFRRGRRPQQSDIIGLAPGDEPGHPSVLVEVKGRRSGYNQSRKDMSLQLDNYRDANPEASCFVLMPEARAGIRSPTDGTPPFAAGRALMERPYTSQPETILKTAADWTIKTFEQLAEAACNYLDDPPPGFIDPDLLLVARLLDIHGLDATP